MLKTVWLVNNLSLIIAESTKVCSNGSDDEDEIVKRLPFKNLNKVTSYLTPNAKKTFIQLR